MKIEYRERICPVCRRGNPIRAIYCDQCGFRLNSFQGQKPLQGQPSIQEKHPERKEEEKPIEAHDHVPEDKEEDIAYLGEGPYKDGLSIVTYGLSKHFGKIIALDEVNLKVTEAEIFSLLGPNGAGKTTLIRILTCLIKPSKGEARVCGLDIKKDGLKIKEKVGVVTQQPCLYLDLTGEENLKFFGRLYGVTGSKLMDRISYLSDLIQLDDRIRSLVGTYSEGMKKRLSIACSLVHEPELLFLDEPTPGLDPQTKLKIWGLIRDLKKSGITVVLSTHSMEEADRLSDHIAILDHGKVIAEGTPSEVKGLIKHEIERPTLEDVFIHLTGTQLRE